MLRTIGLTTLMALSACAPAPQTNPGTPDGHSTPSATTSGDVKTVSCKYSPHGEPSKPVDPPPTKDVPASGEASFTLNTNQGPVTITMDRSKSPCTVNSFESLATQGFFNNTKCHRLADSGLFMLQCGDPTGTGTGGPGYAFADELPAGADPTKPEMYPTGTVAMANAGPGTNGSQFFLVYQDSQLPPAYTKFGTMDAEATGVVARIAAEGQDGSNGDGTGKPNNHAEIKDVTAG